MGSGKGFKLQKLSTSYNSVTKQGIWGLQIDRKAEKNNFSAEQEQQKCYGKNQILLYLLYESDLSLERHEKFTW